MKKLLIGTVFIITGLLTCNKHSNSEKHNDSNRHMNKNSFQELVDRFESKNRAEWQKPEFVLDKFGDLNGKEVADIGAGTGYFSFRLANRGASVYALDVDQRFLDYIEIHKGDKSVSTRLIPTNDPSIEYKSIDAAITVNTYHHINDRPLYFREVFHALKENGKLLVVDFKKEDSPHGPPLKMRVSGQTVMKELHKAGFSKIIIDVTSLPEQYIVSAKKTKSPETNASGL